MKYFIASHEANFSVILRAEDVTRDPQHCGTEDLKCLKEHANQDG